MFKVYVFWYDWEMKIMTQAEFERFVAVQKEEAMQYADAEYFDQLEESTDQTEILDLIYGDEYMLEERRFYVG